MSNANKLPAKMLWVIVPVVKHGDPVKVTVPVTGNKPSAVGVELWVRVAVALIIVPGDTVDVNVPCQDPVTEGTRLAEIVPLSPAAQPVPLTLYVPVNAVADEPLALTVTTCPTIDAEVKVTVSPLTDPEIGTSVFRSKQTELMCITPEILLPL
jgi:hypothetical protein